MLLVWSVYTTIYKYKNHYEYIHKSGLPSGKDEKIYINYNTELFISHSSCSFKQNQPLSLGEWSPKTSFIIFSYFAHS